MIYGSLIRPLLFRLPSDAVHERTLRLAAAVSDRRTALRMVRRLTDRLAQSSTDLAAESLRNARERAGGHGDSGPTGDPLHVRVLGQVFSGPVGLAAGFDKNARIIGLIRALGFGSMEVGSITALASPGNPLPRSFRLPADHALVNRMGLNNDGAVRITERLDRLRADARQADPAAGGPFPVGVNIAKTHDPRILGEHALQDYMASFRRALPVADYVTLNVSCPNTAEGKTFEEAQPLQDLLRRVMEHRSSSQRRDLPVLVKFSPDLDRGKLLELLSICLENRVDGYVAGNTSSGRDNLRTPESEWRAMGKGGLSGGPIRQASTRLVERIAGNAPDGTPIIGCGGVFTADDVLEKIRAGAVLVQLYTSMVYEGPWVAARIHAELRRRMLEKGARSLRELAAG